jgi:hypothetical protein
MRKILAMLTSVIVFAIVSGAYAAPSTKVQVTLSLTPARTLPGLAVPIVLHIKNVGPMISLAPSVSLRFTASDGSEPFLAEWVDHSDFGRLDLGTEDNQPLTIGANETVDLGLPAFGLDETSWAVDRRLTEKPGVWRVEALLYDSRDSDDDPPVAVSSTATLTIETPTERDLPIWKAIRNRQLPGMVEKIFSEQPDSPYMPYIAPLVVRHSSFDKIAVLERAITLHPDSPVVPWLRSGIANHYVFAAGRAFAVDEDLERAVVYSQQAREQVLRIAQNQDAWSKVTGRKKLEELPTRAYFEDRQRIAREKGIRKKP